MTKENKILPEMSPYATLPVFNLGLTPSGKLVRVETLVKSNRDSKKFDPKKALGISMATDATHDVTNVVMNGMDIEVATARPRLVRVVDSFDQLAPGQYKVLGVFATKPTEANEAVQGAAVPFVDVFNSFF